MIITDAIEIAHKVTDLLDGIGPGKGVWVVDPIELTVSHGTLEEFSLGLKGTNGVNVLAIRMPSTLIHLPVDCVFLGMDAAYKAAERMAGARHQATLDQLRASRAKATVSAAPAEKEPA